MIWLIIKYRASTPVRQCGKARREDGLFAVFLDVRDRGLLPEAHQVGHREREDGRGAALDFGVDELAREQRHGLLQAVLGILHEDLDGGRGAAADDEVRQRLLGARLDVLHLGRRNRLDLLGGGGLRERDVGPLHEDLLVARGGVLVETLGKRFACVRSGGGLNRYNGSRKKGERQGARNKLVLHDHESL